MQEPTPPLVVAVCGSLRDRSRTRVALEQVLSAAEAEGARTTLVDLREYDLPPLKGADGPVPDAERFREAIADADSVVLGTPNYHGSYSGLLKNALDYCEGGAFEGKTVGLLEMAAGDFPGSALMHMRIVSRTLGGWTLPTEVAIPSSHSIVSDDGIDDPGLADRTRTLGTELVAYAGGPDRFETEPQRASGERETPAGH